MKLLIYSDLHLENNPAFEPLPVAVDAADVIVLAGDIHPAPDGIVWARQTFGDKPIVYVAGNHEFYDCEFESALHLMQQSAREHDVHFLENDAVTILGTRFLGCTLWTDFEFYGAERKDQLMAEAEARWPDYIGRIQSRRSITGRLQPDYTAKRHGQSRTWLAQQLPLGDPATTVVITHHYPNRKSTSPKYFHDEMNVVFGSHLPDALVQQAGLWVHGHGHNPVNYRIQSQAHRYTRVIANPRGFECWDGEPENHQFHPGYLAERLTDGNWVPQQNL